MAGLGCMNEDGNAAVFVGTLLESGDSVTLCPPCLVGWAIGIVEGGTGLPVSAILAEAQQTPDEATPTDTEDGVTTTEDEPGDSPEDSATDTPEDSTASDQ